MHQCFEAGTHMVDSNSNTQWWWEVERDAGGCRLHVGLVGGEAAGHASVPYGWVEEGAGHA